MKVTQDKIESWTANYADYINSETWKRYRVGFAVLKGNITPVKVVVYYDEKEVTQIESQRNKLNCLGLE
jgi:hypothetical protein